MAVAIQAYAFRPEREEYERAREYAAARLRVRAPARVFDNLTPEQWREITRGDRPEVSGRWRDPKKAR